MVILISLALLTLVCVLSLYWNRLLRRAIDGDPPGFYLRRPGYIRHLWAVLVAAMLAGSLALITKVALSSSSGIAVAIMVLAWLVVLVTYFNGNYSLVRAKLELEKEVNQ